MPTLLLSDDSAIVQRMMAMTFAAEHINVTAVTDGEQAIARIITDRPDVVLAGIATPKRTGYDVAAFVKSEPRLAAIPVLLLAGPFDPIDHVRAAQVRCDGILIKPLDPQQVVARVKELIGASRKGAVQPGAPPRPSVTSALPSPAAPAPRSGSTVDDYFEQLDAAFAERQAPKPDPAWAPPVVAPATVDTGVVPTLDSVLQQGSTPASRDPLNTPPAGSAPAPREAVVTDALVSEVTRRVIERLGTAAIKDVVADVIADTAERLIREEIARIRSK